MKTITIETGKVNDIFGIYYLSVEKSSGTRATPYDELISKTSYGSDIKIILKYDSGCYPGTISDINANKYRNMVDGLIEQEIIERCKFADGSDGFVSGKNYGANT